MTRRTDRFDARHSRGRSTMSPSTEGFAAVIAEVADTLVDEFDLIDFLHTVTRTLPTSSAQRLSG